MLNLEYTTTPQETSQTTLLFLSNRPLVAIMFAAMKFACIMLCLGFAIVVYEKSVRPQDVVSLITALIWLFYYKSINRWIIKSTLKARKFTDIQYNLNIDNKSIVCRFDQNNIQYIEWKKVKYILDTKDGYVIPLTGFNNAGKFLWLPLRAFTSPTMQPEFLELANKFKVKIKKIK